MLDLKAKDKQVICELAKQSFTSEIDILAYGSRVNGDNHDASDLDLVIKTKNHEKLDIEEFVSFKEKLQHSNIPIFVQVMDWSRIPKTFHNNINLKNELVFSNY